MSWEKTVNTVENDTMRRSSWAVVGGLAAVLAWGTTAGAQTNALNAFGAYPSPLPYGQAPGSYVVGPAAPGSGGTYGYVQQNVGAGMGMSPNAYYSTNFFTSTPMSRSYPYAYSSGYAGYPGTGYTTGTTYNPAYANANRYYYNRYNPNYGASTRRGGVFRRMFNR